MELSVIPFFVSVDIDECFVASEEGKDLCPGGIMECKNIPGSFECMCPPGFKEEAGECKGECIWSSNPTVICKCQVCV